MSKLSTPQLRVPSVDRFEAIEFDATDLNADKDPEAGIPKVSFLTNSGQRLTLPFGPSAAEFTKLATWATEVATLLTEQGRK